MSQGHYTIRIILEIIAHIAGMLDMTSMFLTSYLLSRQFRCITKMRLEVMKTSY